MYIIWDSRMIRMYDPGRGWTEYNNCLDPARSGTGTSTPPAIATTSTSPCRGTAPRGSPAGGPARHRPSRTARRSRRALPRERGAAWCVPDLGAVPGAVPVTPTALPSTPVPAWARGSPDRAGASPAAPSTRPQPWPGWSRRGWVPSSSRSLPRAMPQPPLLRGPRALNGLLARSRPPSARRRPRLWFRWPRTGRSRSARRWEPPTSQPLSSATRRAAAPSPSPHRLRGQSPGRASRAPSRSSPATVP